ncbi:hypothetical protein AB0395_13915 [Streptosporangium sp. NPDC051023]|uniref:hypothetical protein n=1 Tax=Streptosporangium sp. NPDC051023 TaxID=3155410 RepID=UPI00344D8CA7
MTERDPERLEDEIEDAGTVGARRQRVSEPVAPGEKMSLNLPPTVPDGPPVPTGESTGVEEAGRMAGTVETGRVAGPGDAGTAGAAGGTSAHDGGTSGRSAGRDIDNDRREPGETVEALMHKTDVKGRVHETATQVGGELRRMGTATATTATGMVGRVKEAAPGVVGKVREAAPEVVGRVKDVTPADVKDAAGKVTTEVGKRPVTAVAALAVLAMVVVRLLRRGKKK